MSLEDYLDNVVDEKSFIEFAKALQADKEEENRIEKEEPSPPYSQGHNGWENGSIEAFLESSIAWSEDTNFGEMFSKDLNPWRKFANFLLAGKFYE